MADKLRILGISGSLRAGSFNTALLKGAISVGGEHGLEITLHPLDDIPFYNGDVEAAGDPPGVVRLKQAVTEADGLLVASPEYNHSITAPLKNAIDWAARNPKGGGIAFAPMANKPVAIMGAGGRAGTARGQLHLRQVLAETRSNVMVQPTLLVDRARDRYVDGKWDEETLKGLHALLDGLRGWVGRFSG